MTLEDFRKLDGATKVKLVNKRLSELKESSKTHKDFKCDDLKFSYTTAVEEMKHIGYELKGKTFVKTLTGEDIEVLLELSKCYGQLMISRFNLGAQIQESSDIKATTLKVDVDTLADWQAFCKDHSDFSAPGLLGAALRNFMNLYR